MLVGVFLDEDLAGKMYWTYGQQFSPEFEMPYIYL